MKKPLALPAISFRPEPETAALLAKEAKQPWFSNRSRTINLCIRRTLEEVCVGNEQRKANRRSK